jgi:hypothetical protein
MSFLNDVRNFIEGNYRFFNFKNNPEHINEQAFYRAAKCQDCLKAGKCRHCGCTTPNMFFSPNKIDALNKWGVMLDEEGWKKFKNSDNEYKVFLSQQKVTKQNVEKGDKFYRQQQELLGYTPPLSDPFYPYREGIREEGLVEDHVGDSSDAPHQLSVLQPSDQGERGNSSEGLPGIGNTTLTITVDSGWFPGSDNDSGTEITPNMEEENRREKQST